VIDRFKQVVPNILFRGSAPSPSEVLFLKEDHGIERIVSLDKECGEEIKDACHDNDIEHIIIPVEGGEKGDLGTKMLRNLNVTSLVGDKPTFVHCKHGKDRTGVFVAKYEVENGKSPEQAINNALELDFGLGLDKDTLKRYIDIIYSAMENSNKREAQDDKTDAVSEAREEPNKYHDIDDESLRDIHPLTSKRLQGPPSSRECP